MMTQALNALNISSSPSEESLAKTSLDTLRFSSIAIWSAILFLLLC
jgi:hypothetical protein